MPSVHAQMTCFEKHLEFIEQVEQILVSAVTNKVPINFFRKEPPWQFKID